MKWKAIGSSAMGTSHASTGGACEDALQFRILGEGDDSVLICCMSDGAGSAKYAAFASGYCSTYAADALSDKISGGNQLSEADIYQVFEDMYAGLALEAEAQGADLGEYSCTFLGCCLSGDASIFFQLGDGAIVLNDGSGYYVPVWWPDNGEYQNTTSFVTDDPSFKSLRISIMNNRIDEVALFTDGLQMLALQMEIKEVHQPFFKALFPTLRLADDTDKLHVLQRKLGEYLNSDRINSRTNDDKTLFLGTRL